MKEIGRTFREIGKGWFTHDGEAGWYPISVDAQDEAAGSSSDSMPILTRAIGFTRLASLEVRGGASGKPPACVLAHYHGISSRRPEL